MGHCSLCLGLFSEENTYDEYENDLGITAIALYDYQAGEAHGTRKWGGSRGSLSGVWLQTVTAVQRSQLLFHSHILSGVFQLYFYTLFIYIYLNLQFIVYFEAVSELDKFSVPTYMHTHTYTHTHACAHPLFSVSLSI